MLVDRPGAILLELAPPRSRRDLRRYWRATRRPVYGVAVVLGLVLLYEVAARLAPGEVPGRGVLAHQLIRSVFAWLGLGWPWIVPLATAGALLGWLWRSHERRTLRASGIGGIFLEGTLLALPLLVVGALFSDPSPRHWLAALGGAAYEEFLFRLGLLVLIRLALIEIFQMRRAGATWLAIVLSALAFALGHFEPFGGSAFVARLFWFKLAAGLYLGLLFEQRGLAVAAACHVAYNLLVVAMRGGG